MIVSNPNIMLGKPVIRGTRITVEHILRELAGGMTVEDLLEAHPHITREEIRAALEFAQYDTDLLNAFTVVTAKAVRVRPNPSI